MTKIYLTDAATGVTRTVDAPCKDCWISMVNPSDEEQKLIAQRYNIDIDDVRAALDDDERSRIEFEDDYTLILVDIPSVEMRDGVGRYVTIPLAVIIAKDAVITVCLEDTPVLEFFGRRRARGFSTAMKTRFILQILYHNATLYLQYLRNIEKQSEAVENQLYDSTENHELLELLELKKSLLYFTTSLRSNESVLDKLLKSEAVKKYPEDTDLLEDVIVENRQAMEMANIYSGILSGTLDAYASIISNNQNSVMYFLTIATIVLSIPNIVFGAYGMNISESTMPFAANPFAFWIIIGVSLVLAVAVFIYFSKKKMY